MFMMMRPFSSMFVLSSKQCDFGQKGMHCGLLVDQLVIHIKSMMNFTCFMKIGKELGLEGDKLSAFVQNCKGS